jgi:Ni/Fe-hydrogenase subunit HybB-like protein
VGAEPGIPLGEVRETTALGLPGISSFEATGVYAPTWAEVSIIIGVLALGVLLIMWGVQALPLLKRETVEAANPGSEEQSQLGREPV